MVKREGGRAYLLITFDLPNQRIVASEEVVGPFEGEFNNVTVDWQRVFRMVKLKRSEEPPKIPPWTDTRADRKDAEDPPKIPPWTDADVDDVERPPRV